MRVAPQQSIPIVAAALLSLLIALSLPIAAAAHAITGDALIVRLAGRLLAGEWLGAYDPGTLMVGLPYAALVAKGAFLGVPLKVAEAVLQLAASGAVAFIVVRLGLRAWLGAAVFVLLAFNPVPWSPLLMRVTGEAFAGSLALLALAALSFVLLADSVSVRRRRVVLAAFGLAFALFWQQDPIAAWVYPALLVPVLRFVPGLVRVLRTRPIDTAAWRARAAPFALDAAAVLAPFAVVTLSVAAINLSSYGAFVTGEARGGAFAEAVGALTRITPIKASQRFEFAPDTAAHAYRVSAAARELKPHLEGAIGQRWRAVGCRTLALNPCPAGFGGGTLVWALRDAARAAGHMDDAAAADAFFARLADEIDSACDTGDVACGSSRVSLISPLRAGEWRALAGGVANALAVMTRMGDGEAGAAASDGSAAEITAFAKLAGAVTARAETAVALNGWVASTTCLPRPVIDEADGTVIEPELLPADDVDAFFRAKGQYPTTQRFRLRAPCREAACTMRLEGCGEAAGVPVWSLSAGSQRVSSKAILFLDSVTGTSDTAVPVADDGWAAGVARTIAIAYAALGPVVAPFAVIMFGLAWVSSRDYPDLTKPWIVAAAALVAVIGRAAYVGFIDVTTMPAADIRHMAPAAPFFLLFLGLSGALALTALVRRLRSDSDDKSAR